MAIRLLDAHTAELIAAGEVVERPASVVKELAENAIDAGAGAVTVTIERGGIALIRVEDDGAGIEAGDIPLAFVRHATSKVQTEKDLEAIKTLGFRGEALASIASVAHVQLLTKTNSDDASVFSIDGGQPGRVEDAARPRGTTITVQDLFYNTPARMKFLKKDASEGSYVTETVSRLALSHPEVAFRYVRDGKQIFATAGDGDLRGAAYAVLGAQFARGLVKVELSQAQYAVRGLVASPRALRASRSMQFFFINGRFVKNRTMMAAMEQAYRGMMMQGRFPGGLLFLHMPAELVDVNVHPAKTEVRFAREQDIFDVVYRAVKAALVEAAAEHGSLELGGGEAAKEEGACAIAPVKQNGITGAPPQGGVLPSGVDVPENKRNIDVKPFSPAAAYVMDTAKTGGTAPQGTGVLQSEAAVRYETGFASAGISARLPGAVAAAREYALDIEPEEQEADQQVLAGTAADQKVASALRLVGEVFHTYIVAESSSCMVVIDKHAAHERLLYERIAAAHSEGGGTQMLLAPVNVVLSAAEKEALLQNIRVLQQAGIEIEDFGGNSVLVRGVPAELQDADVSGLVVEVAARMVINPKDSRTEKAEWVRHSMACRAAMKAGDKTRPEQLLKLAQDIMDGVVPPFCPHGRPVVLQLTQKDLEKQFGRLG